jgi:HAD superfamily hydrolase (TIGR01509 family)
MTASGPDGWPPPPAAVCFDLGGVLVQVELDRSRDRWQELTGLARDTFDAVFFRSGLKDRLDLGKLTADRVPDEVNRLAGTALTDDQVVDVWNACIVSLPEAVELVERSRRRARIGVISDTDAIHARFIQETSGLLPLVEVWTFSFELGRKKPDERVFVDALRRLGVERPQALFIDDRAINVEQARYLGLQADVCRDVESLASILEQRGLIG